jgi:hypothetical protein
MTKWSSKKEKISYLNILHLIASATQIYITKRKGQKRREDFAYAKQTEEELSP